VVHYRTKSCKGPRCGDCGNTLQGLPRLRPAAYSRLPKRQRRVNRSYGGSRCYNCTKNRIVRAFLIEEQKIVKHVIKMKTQRARAPKPEGQKPKEKGKKPEAKGGKKQQPKKDTKKTDTKKTDTKKESKKAPAKAKSEAKPEAKTEAKSEAKQETKPKAEAKPTKAETKKGETKKPK